MRKNIPQLIFGACSMDCKAQGGSVAVVRGWAFLDVHRWHLACWHGKLSSKEAEERLVAVNKINAYLLRESEVKRNKFILSYISD